jgi:hypothetical protein
VLQLINTQIEFYFLQLQVSVVMGPLIDCKTTFVVLTETLPCDTQQDAHYENISTVQIVIIMDYNDYLIWQPGE